MQFPYPLSPKPESYIRVALNPKSEQTRKTRFCFLLPYLFFKARYALNPTKGQGSWVGHGFKTPVRGLGFRAWVLGGGEGWPAVSCTKDLS